jgi:hypothetical protein
VTLGDGGRSISREVPPIIAADATLAGDHLDYRSAHAGRVRWTVIVHGDEDRQSDSGRQCACTLDVDAATHRSAGVLIRNQAGGFDQHAGNSTATVLEPWRRGRLALVRLRQRLDKPGAGVARVRGRSCDPQ